MTGACVLAAGLMLFYKVWRSDTGASYEEVYSGPYDSPAYMYVPSNSIPDYAKAQACNANGCSAFSNLVLLAYQGSCS